MKMSSKAFIRKLAVDPSYAIVPIKVAARALDLTRASVERMLNDGRLEEVCVSDIRCVRANGIIARLKEMDARTNLVYARLEIVARSRGDITYGPLMGELGLDSTLSKDRNLIAKILEMVSRRSEKESKILLSVLVRRKSRDAMPGPGFFAMAKSLGYPFEDSEQFVREQTERVWNYYAPKPRRRAA